MPETKRAEIAKPQIGAGKVEKPGAVPIDRIQPGWWTEPDPPPATTAVLDLDQPDPSVAALLLRANLPSTVRLRGPRDLLFRALTIRLAARPLVRNLARPEWGSTRSGPETGAGQVEITLAAPARIEAVGVRTTKATSAVPVEYEEGGYRSNAVLALYPFGSGKWSPPYSGVDARTVVVRAVRLSSLDAKAEILLRSPSAPSRISLALGDDTPAQLFPHEMEPGATATSRDLTGLINAAWQRGISGDIAEVALRITSLTDGVVRVDLAGSWDRSYASPPVSLTLDPVAPAAIAIPWPFGALPDAVATLRLAGQIEGGRRLGLAAGPSTFQVRATERVQVAQAIRIAAGDPPASMRQVQAVWLMLPRLPRSAGRLEIRLAEAAGNPPFPADEALARMEVTLPADAAAYLLQPGGCWYRAPLERPLDLDGAQVTRPLFLVAAGRDGGTLLAHSSLAIPQGAGRTPDGVGAGLSLVRNLDRAGTWAVQSFNRQAARWLVDLELALTPGDYQDLLTLAWGAGSPVPLPLKPSPRVSLESGLHRLARPAPYRADEAAPPVLTATLASAVRASLTAQLILHRAIQG